MAAKQRESAAPGHGESGELAVPDDGGEADDAEAEPEHRLIELRVVSVVEIECSIGEERRAPGGRELQDGPDEARGRTDGEASNC